MVATVSKPSGKKSIKDNKALYKYQAVYPQAKMDMKYHYYDGDVLKINNNLFRLITSIDELKEYAEKCKGKKIGVDTETTGLSYYKDFIVGFSLSYDRYHGVYVPIRHQIRRVDKVKQTKRDENGNILYTKTGKPRSETVNKYTDFENPCNLPAKEALDILYDIMLNANLNILHNSEFDLTMLKAEGYDIMKLKTFDTTVLTYLYDAENKGWNKLKEASKTVLGRYPMKFYEALGDEENFRYVDLAVGFPYAAADAANTLGIFEELYPAVKELLSKAPGVISVDGTGKPYNVLQADNELIRAFTDYYNHVDLLVNRDTAKEYQKTVEKDLADVEEAIYSYFDIGPFNLSPSSKEFKQTMDRFHIDTGLKTDTGAVSYGKKGIEEMGRNLKALKDLLLNFKVVDYKEETHTIYKQTNVESYRVAKAITSYGGGQFNFNETVNTLKLKTLEGIYLTKHELFDELKLMYKAEMKKLEVLQNIQKRSSYMKALNSYIEKLTQVDSCHMRYRLQGTSSGRLSSGNGSKNDKSKNHYYIDLNAQNLTKPHSAMYEAYKSDEDKNVLGWKFKPVTEDYMKEHPDGYYVEGSEPKKNIRACIIAPEGRLIASLDYSAEEYKVLAGISQDTVMLNNFRRGLDPHTSTAYAIWGEENYDRQKRKKAKICNFLMNYGGGAHTLSQSLDIPLQEAEEIIEGYEKGFWECTSWKKNTCSEVRSKQDGTCYSMFGRPRQFKTLMSTASCFQDVLKLREYEAQGYDKAEIVRKGEQIDKGVDRRIISHVIQGACGDICRWDLIQLYRKFFRNRDPHVDFLTTVHDEINFTIDLPYVVDYCRQIDDIMTFTKVHPDLPITTSIDLGYELGILFPFEWEDEDRLNLIPKRA